MQPVSIMGKHLNNFERLSILEDYLSGSDSKVAIEQKYGLSHGLIRSWLSKFGLEDKVHPVPMKVSQSPQSELPLNEKEELEQLRKENRVLKSRLKREELGHQAYKLLVELAEETYGIRIPKKLRSQVVHRLSEPERSHPIARLCELLGFSRQAFYKRHLNDLARHEEDVLCSSIIQYCWHLRQAEHLPQAGFRELMVLCQQYFGPKFTLGRDRFYALLRRHGMMLRKRSVRPRTTNSRHRLYKYEDLLNTEPKFVPQRPGELLVADITYVAYQDGFAYLSLLTDAYSRCIVGYCLHPTLEVEGCLNALHQAFAFYDQHQIDTSNMIHHSDRGIQYAGKSYTDLLHGRGCRISMTQTGDPLHNALAERMNNTLKNSWHISSSKQSFDQALLSVDRAVRMYNEARPHQALRAKTPMQVITPESENPLLARIEHWPEIAPELYRRMNVRQKANFARVNRN
ncbi:IS3 family transposase [Porphyromonas gingivalis]|uniref:IS3 family transposase n=1 Tax=Porphyromonas gingivalis TaxID=837 RepID=UPI001B8D1393|nr:IS3 family transposase [Porphyromonas gingivalis]QUI90058.1 IS3 family transposase [Porphyromonas gingivalis]